MKVPTERLTHEDRLRLYVEEIPARVDAWPTGRKLVSRNDLRNARK